MRTDHRGGTLADRLRSGPLGRDELQQLARDLLGMLVSLHAEGTLHRDLNPASVRLDTAGRLHSSKIGAQRAPGSTGPLGPTGPQNYLAPEVLAGGTWDVGSDLFACGVLLGDAAGPDASAPVLVLIGMLTAAEPDLRPASAAEALALLGATTPPAPRAPIPAPAPGFRQSFEKPAAAASPAPPVPVPVPRDLPTQPIKFPPVQHFPPVEPPPVMAAPAVTEAPRPVDLAPAYPPVSYPPVVAYPRLRRRPGRRLVLAVAAALAGLAIVAIGAVAMGGDDAAEPTIPAPSDAPLHQQLDDLDSAIDLVTK